MSSDLSMFDSDLPFMPSGPLFPFSDILLQDIPIDRISAIADYGLIIPSSPQSHQLDDLSLSQAAPVSLDFPGFCFTGVPQEGATKGYGCPVGYDQTAFVGPHRYGGHEGGISSHIAQYMQGTYSSVSFYERPETGLYQPQFDALIEPPQNCFPGGAQMRRVAGGAQMRRVAGGAQMRRVAGGAQMRRVAGGAQMRRVAGGAQMRRVACLAQMRRVCSYGYRDLKVMKRSSVDRYSAAERKERILKYRAKRSQRNFTKTIKYACRKVLADSRPRIRGRFARSDQVVQKPPKAISSSSVRDDDFPSLGKQDEDATGAGSVGPSPDQVQIH
ncbi:hypothetical protein SAY86_003925 [Trapa natans]|uniref:CCT domain-containing protein n=1 Tax=Trapa natans TaxID=22666 RepID=A0AAN7RPT5_TRANT|nr:hypothetical protein SAY86_003925 [Trapa natans]